MNRQRGNSLWPSIVAGASSGALVLVAYGWLNAPTEPVAEQSAGLSIAQLNTAPTTDANRSTAAEDQRRLTLIEQQLAQLAQAAPAQNAADHASASDQDATATTDSEPPMTIEDAKQLALQDWQRKRENFLLEPVDQRWAQNTSEMFRADVSALAQEHGFSVIQSDCRTRHCAVIVEWPSFEEAVDGFKVLLHHDYQANCARETLLPDPDPAAAGSPYQATMIFDCGDLRQQG